MTFTLWRGEYLLGELWKRPPSPHDRVAREDRPPTLSAFLIPSGQSRAPDGVWQIHQPFFGIGVQQQPVEPDIVAERDHRAKSRRPNSGPVALEPMSEEQIAGVPRELQLTIRDEQGQVWLPRQIWLGEIRYGPEHIERAGREAPPEALVNGSIWCVAVGFASDSEAPAT